MVAFENILILGLLKIQDEILLNLSTADWYSKASHT